MKIKYGIELPDDANALSFELYAFRIGQPVEKGGLGRIEHLWRLINFLYGKKVEVNPWLEWCMESLCENTYSYWTGCATAGKTFAAGLFALTWWMASPGMSAVILTSTTASSVRRRVWPVIQRLYNPQWGFNMVDSRTTLQVRKGDDLHGVFAKAIKEGPVEKAVADIQGVHPSRLMLVIDEATATPDAIFEAIPNLSKGLEEFKLLVIGNAVSHMDPHGRCCEPKYGWNSITVEDEEWETRGVPQWQCLSGKCLHFDGTKSPNVLAGEDKYPRIYTNADLKKAKANPEAEKSIGFWKFDRGFWAGEGVCRTVMSEALLQKHEAGGTVIFNQSVDKVAGLDPSFTADGDGCVLRFGKMGLLANGLGGIQLEDRVKITIRPGTDIYYQIAENTIHECKARGVEARNLAIDISGGGKGVADIVEREWAPGIHRVEFGGFASELPASLEDPRPSNDVYGDRVTELWFSIREFIVGGQLKGIRERESVEFVTREYDLRSRKIVIDEKKKVRDKIGRSPDDGDAIATIVDLARMRGYTPGGASAIRKNETWDELVRNANAVYENVDYAPV